MPSGCGATIEVRRFGVLPPLPLGLERDGDTNLLKEIKNKNILEY